MNADLTPSLSIKNPSLLPLYWTTWTIEIALKVSFLKNILGNFLEEWLGGFPGGSVGKESTCNAGDKGDVGSVPRLGRSLGGGQGNPLQYSCLEDPMERGAWQGYQSMGSQRVGQDWSNWACKHAHTYLKILEVLSHLKYCLYIKICTNIKNKMS